MESYDDPAKSLAREEEYRFIRNYIISNRINPLQMKVVCLETLEALEIKMVFDRLGIPRSNIIVIECVKKVAEQIEAQNLGVKIINSWDWQYFLSTTDGPFHVISLDYKGTKSYKIGYSISLIAWRQLLHNPGVLLINNIGARENHRTKKYLTNIATGAAVAEKISSETGNQIIINPNQLMENYNEYMDSFSQAQKTWEIKNARDYFTLEVLNTMRKGEEAWHSLKDLCICYPGAEDVNNAYKEKLLKKKKQHNLRDEELIHIEFMDIHFGNMIDYIMKLLNITSKKDAESLYLCLQSYLKHGYFAKKLARYKYTSINGTVMELDMYNFKRFDKLFNKIKNIFFLREKYNGYHVLKFNSAKIQIINSKKFQQLLFTIYRQTDNKQIIFPNPNIINQLPKRIHLGSSSQMEISNINEGTRQQDSGSSTSLTCNTITKEEVIELLKDGCEPREIVECFSGFTLRSLSAIKAHLTMGTYG